MMTNCMTHGLSYGTLCKHCPPRAYAEPAVTRFRELSHAQNGTFKPDTPIGSSGLPPPHDSVDEAQRAAGIDARFMPLDTLANGKPFFQKEALEAITQPTEKPMLLDADPATRKAMPISTGVLDYFPLAMAEVAKVSKAGNDQHNPGKPLHWDKTKSLDHADCIARHLIDRGSRDTDGMRHSAKLAWRALALLQTELETAK